MGNAITQDRRAVWLMLARDGGWWTVKALLHHWKPTFAQWELQEALDGLLPGGYVTRREMTPGQVSYAVTSDCVPLPGLRLDGTEQQEGTHA